MGKGYRIISIEACEIYKHEQEYGVAAGYKLPEKKSDAYFWLFKNRLDNSLDTIELEKAYTRVCRKKFAFQDSFGNNYTVAVVNLKFNYTYKPQDGKPVAIKELRKYYYENGFDMDGVHYVRYKRSAGSLGIFLESIFTKVHQAGGNMVVPMIAQISGAVTNIVLDPLLIFGLWIFPELGIAGGICHGYRAGGGSGYHRDKGLQASASR